MAVTVPLGAAPRPVAGESGESGRRPASRRRYAPARLAAIVGTGVAAAGFWVGVVSAPLPVAAGQSRQGADAQDQGGRMASMAGMQHGPGAGGMGQTAAGGAGGARSSRMDHSGMSEGGAMRHGPGAGNGGMAGPRLRTRSS